MTTSTSSTYAFDESRKVIPYQTFLKLKRALEQLGVPLIISPELPHRTSIEVPKDKDVDVKLICIDLGCALICQNGYCVPYQQRLPGYRPIRPYIETL